MDNSQICTFGAALMALAAFYWIANTFTSWLASTDHMRDIGFATIFTIGAGLYTVTNSRMTSAAHELVGVAVLCCGFLMLGQFVRALFGEVGSDPRGRSK